VRVAYEAGPTGFGLARTIIGAGMECLVAAPSKLQRPPGDRVKTDARDAAHLARLLRLGEITAVRVPEREVEAVRDLVRAREDARADLMRVRHRLSKLLLRQGFVYSGGTPWTCAHEEWLRRHHFDDVHLKAAFDHGFDAVLAATAARDRLQLGLGMGRVPHHFASVGRLGSRTQRRCTCRSAGACARRLALFQANFGGAQRRPHLTLCQTLVGLHCLAMILESFRPVESVTCCLRCAQRCARRGVHRFVVI